MAATIPIANLYYLLAYAWNHRLTEAELASVDADSCPDLNNFFARVLTTGTRSLLRRGLDRSYLAETEETPRIRGRIDFATSEKTLSRTRGKLVCTYDELSPDVLHNRILKATLRLLLGDASLESELRPSLRQVLEPFGRVIDLRVSPRHFHRVQLHRNNRAYRFLLHLCELVHRSHLPARAPDGRLRFRDFARDERIMARVFEDFVRNFAGRHLTGARVSAPKINWTADDFTGGAEHALPAMHTDVAIVWPHRKLILDCKYYREALTSRYDTLRHRSGNLYQLNAYLTNQAHEPGWEQAEGMLLYPSNGYHLRHRFTLHRRHPVTIATIDLAQPWPVIHSELNDLLESRPP